jgi:hypothetical protein
MKLKSFIIVLFGVVLLSFSPSKQLSNFDELMSALRDGKTVSAVFYYGKCQLYRDNKLEDKSIDATGGMKIETWEYFAEGVIHNKNAFVVASSSSLIQNPIGKGFVYNYVKIKVSSDNKVSINAKYVKAKSMKVTMDETFKGSISTLDTNGGIYFFVQ